MVPHTATWRHLRECSVKAANTVPSGTTATLQALSSHCFLVAQPASPTPAPCMQPHLLHLQHWQPRWNRLQLFLPCQLFRRMPQHQSLWHPMPHLCSHKDLAVPAWHQDAWSRRSRNCWPGLSMDFDCNVLPSYIPNKLCIKLSCIIISKRGMSYDRVISFRFKKCLPPIDW